MKLVFILMAVAAMAAPPESASQKRGSEIVESSLTALGGPAFDGMNTRMEEGRVYSFYRSKMTGRSRARIYTSYVPAKAHGTLSVVERQSFGKDKEDFAILFMPSEGLEISYRGIRPIPEDQWQRYRETAFHNVFTILRTRRKEPGMIFEYESTETLDNAPVEIVNITDSENRVTKVYFHRTTHLPLRQIFYRRDPKTRQRFEEVTIFSKYRDSDGVQWPWSITRMRDGETIYEIISDDVQVNPPKVSDDVFEPPKDAKRLKPL